MKILSAYVVVVFHTYFAHRGNYGLSRVEDVPIYDKVVVGEFCIHEAALMYDLQIV